MLEINCEVPKDTVRDAAATKTIDGIIKEKLEEAGRQI